MKALKIEKLLKEYDNFHQIESETLKQMAARFYHLIAELERYGTKGITEGHVKKFSSGLPDIWSQ